ncbi:hypothetical protein [Methyloversatilis sp. XJ19-49]|uniref:hypothetical protein n=1 Tax=Methyloversatilis sp. XJ19-49 TaxID=2963429 RepID=UPI00211C9335|nr:hypothetical protein [Methyloversatilis sp. XJ19-49]MCQ9376845.1 hypothetical protein [Methyloversatilis sp. XJ19-49]
MTTEHSPTGDASPNMLAAATLFVMTRFAERPCPEVAQMVIRHLEVVAEDERADPLMREVCDALIGRWSLHAVGDAGLRAAH